MIRLWHPMRDPSHCNYRILSILLVAQPKDIPIAKLSFLDLFFLFPEYLHGMRLSKAAADRRRQIRVRRARDSFVHIPDVRLVYRELQKYQKVALDRLVGRGILSSEAYKSQIAQVLPDGIPSKLRVHLDERIEENHELLRFIVDDIGSLPIDGPNSLLRQTHMELGGRLH